MVVVVEMEEQLEIEKKEDEGEEKVVESLKVKASTKERLLKLGKMQDSFDDVINRKLDELEACKLTTKPMVAEATEEVAESTPASEAIEEKPEDEKKKSQKPFKNQSDS